MNNSTTIIKSKIAFLLKEFKKLIKVYNDKAEDYLKDKYYFQDVEEIINDENVNTFSKLNLKYFYLAKEFRNFILKYKISHDHITESILNDIIKIPIEYILHRRQSDYDTDSETGSDDDDGNDNNSTIDNNLQSMINDISKEKTISNNLKQLLISNLLKQSIVNKILKDSTINNKESIIDDVLNEKTNNNINFPPTNQGYENFEINNSEIALNVYELNNEEISQLYKSNYNRIKEVNLLLLENKHYVCIKIFIKLIAFMIRI